MAAGDLSLSILIGASLDGSFGSAIGAATSAIQQLASGNVMGALGTAAVAAGAAVVGLGVSATQAAGSFQQGMNMLVTSAGESATAVKNSSGQVIGGIQMVSDGIKQMAVDTGTSTQQLAAGMYYVESSGQHGANGLTVLRAAAEGAKSENADLTTVTKALTTVMTDYHLPVQDSTAAMNGLIATVQNGKTNLQDLSSSMGNVLPIASALHISFPQVAGALDTMTNAGMSSQQATQNLAHVLVALQAPSKVAQSSMIDVGLSAQQVRDTLVSKGLPEAFQLIEDHVGKKFPAGSVQAETALKNILGGLVGLKTAAMLTGDSLTQTEANINAVAAAYDKGGASVMGWDVVQQGFNFQMDRAKQALDVFMITLGQQLLPILTPIVKGFADFVTGITNFVSGLSDAASSGDTFVKFLTSLGVNAKTAKQIFDDLHTTFGLIGDIASRVGNILQTIFGGALQVVGTLIVGFINGPLNDILQGFNGVLQGIDDFAKSIQDDFTNLSDNATTWGQNLGISFENGLISVAADIIAVAEQIAQGIADYLGFQSPTKKGPGSTLGRWGIGMITGLAQGIVAAGPLITNAVLSVASQLQTASTSGGILHTAVASMIDPLSGDAMTATVTPDAAISHPNTGLNTTALKSSASTTSHSAAATSALVTAVKASASTIASGVASVSSAVTTTAAKASAQKSATSKAAAAQRTAAAQQRAAHTAAMQKAHQQAAQQRAEAAAQRKAAAQQRAQQHAAAVAQRAKLHAEAQAKREQIHQALLAQRAQEKAAKAAAKAGPPAVAGATPNMDMPSISKSLDDIKKKITDAFSPLKDAVANARLLAQNISNSFTGIQAKAQQLQADLKQFFDWLNRTFAPIWTQISETWNQHIIPDLAKIKKSFDDASPSLKDIVKILGQLLALGLLVFFENLAGALYAADYIIERLSDALTLMVQQWLWVQQQLKPVYDWIVQGLQWVYDQIIGHSIIPDLINGIETWFNKLLDFFPHLMSQVKNTLIQWWNQIKNDVTTFWQNVGSIFSSAYQSWIAKPLAGIGTTFSNWWNTQKTSWTTLARNLWTAVQGIFNGAYATQLAPALVKIGQNFANWFTTEATNFGTWATNLIKMFAQGLTTAATTILQPAVNSVATVIKNFLGIQSPAAMGPLSQSHTWMPNLMNMFSQQITAGTPKVTSATNNMAVSIQNAIDQMSQKVQQSVQDMMQKISAVGQSLSQMQSQVSSAVGQMRSDVQNAVDDANAALTSMENTVSSAVGTMNQSISSVSTTLSQMQSNVNTAVNAMNSQINSVSKNVQNMQNQVNAATKNAESTASSSDARINAQNNATLSKMSASLSAFAATSSAGYAKWSAESAAAASQFAAEESKAMATKQYVNAIVASAEYTLATLQSKVQAGIASIDAAISAAAASAASVFGHTEPKTGPLAGDSQWGIHFMQNFITGMQSQIPALASVSQMVATKIVENLLPNTKAMANDVKTALANAAAATGDTITALKQKGDDIYATIQQLSGLAGTPGSSGTYAVTTANIAGDIPVSYQLTPPTPGTAGSTSTQNMTIHIDLDGKTFGKYVGKYINQELHVQGQVRRL